MDGRGDDLLKRVSHNSLHMGDWEDRGPGTQKGNQPFSYHFLPTY